MSNELQTVEFAVGGMDCGGCVRDVEKALKALPGVVEVDVSLKDARAVARIDPEKVTVAALHEAVEDAGFEVPA